MARDQDTPDAASNNEKAEGDRWTSEDDTVERRDREQRGGADRSHDLIGRTKEEHPTTPRRYDQDREDPAMPADDSVLRTEM